MSLYLKITTLFLIIETLYITIWLYIKHLWLFFAISTFSCYWPFISLNVPLYLNYDFIYFNVTLYCISQLWLCFSLLQLYISNDFTYRNCFCDFVSCILNFIFHNVALYFTIVTLFLIIATLYLSKLYCFSYFQLYIYHNLTNHVLYVQLCFSCNCSFLVIYIFQCDFISHNCNSVSCNWDFITIWLYILTTFSRNCNFISLKITSYLTIATLFLIIATLYLAIATVSLFYSISYNKYIFLTVPTVIIVPIICLYNVPISHNCNYIYVHLNFFL